MKVEFRCEAFARGRAAREATNEEQALCIEIYGSSIVKYRPLAKTTVGA